MLLTEILLLPVCRSTSRRHPLLEEAPNGALHFSVEAAAKDGPLLGCDFMPVILSPSLDGLDRP